MSRRFALVLSTALVGCAASVATRPSAFHPTAQSAQSAIVIRVPVELRLSTGYSVSLFPGTRWRLVGRIAEGDVYRPVDSVFTIEGRQVHEAYLVLSGSMLQGFFLPGESNYSPLSTPVKLNLGDSR